MNNALNVIFRTDTETAEVIAFFPEEPGTRDPSTCSVYTRQGQHAHATIGYYREHTRPATEDQYADLHNELQRIERTVGNNRPITTRQRFHHAYNAHRARACA